MRWTAREILPVSIEGILESMSVNTAATKLRPALWHDLAASGESLMSWCRVLYSGEMAIRRGLRGKGGDGRTHRVGTPG